MKTLSYFEKRDLVNMEKIGSYLSELPEYCYDFFTGIEITTSSLTRLNYAMDLSIFFDYISKFILKKDKKEITLKDLDTLEARDIESYLSYLTFYKVDDKVFKNTENGKARKLASVRSFFKYTSKDSSQIKEKRRSSSLSSSLREAIFLSSSLKVAFASLNFSLMSFLSTFIWEYSMLKASLYISSTLSPSGFLKYLFINGSSMVAISPSESTDL